MHLIRRYREVAALWGATTVVIVAMLVGVLPREVSSGPEETQPGPPATTTSLALPPGTTSGSPATGTTTPTTRTPGTSPTSVTAPPTTLLPTMPTVPSTTLPDVTLPTITLPEPDCEGRKVIEVRIDEGRAEVCLDVLTGCGGARRCE